MSVCERDREKRWIKRFRERASERTLEEREMVEMDTRDREEEEGETLKVRKTSTGSPICRVYRSMVAAVTSWNLIKP